MRSGRNVASRKRFKKTLAMDTTDMKSDDVIAKGKERLAFVDEDGVTRTWVPGSRGVPALPGGRFGWSVSGLGSQS